MSDRRYRDPLDDLPPEDRPATASTARPRSLHRVDTVVDPRDKTPLSAKVESVGERLASLRKKRIASRLAPTRQEDKTFVLDGVELNRKAAVRELASLTEDYNFIKTDDSTAGKTLKMDLARRMRKLSEFIHSCEPLVLIEVETDVHGLPFAINGTLYPPGQHKVRASVAQTLLSMMDANQRMEMDRYRNNGVELNLGLIGHQAASVEG